MAKLKSTLEYVTNILLVVVCSLLVWSFVTHRIFSQPSPEPSTTKPSLVGTSLSPIPNHPWNGTRSTLVIAIRLGCPFCRASMPFYRHLSELQRAKQLNADLLLVMPDEEPDVKSELMENGVNIESQYGQNLNAISVFETPTLMLVGSNGRVEQSWVGQLPPAKEGEVIAALEK